MAYGSILAAEFDDGRRLEAFRFVLADGKAGYYDANGRSLKRFFLKSPLKFEPRVTSHFSYNRRHPVLNVRRAHLGVDYAAPIGAPVVAVSNGVVARAGFWAMRDGWWPSVTGVGTRASTFTCRRWQSASASA